MKVVLISLFHYDNFAIRLLFSYLRAHRVDVSYVGFKRMRLKATRTLKNDFIEMNNYHTDVSQEDIHVLLSELEKLQPALVGIGLQSSHFPVAKQLTAAIKTRFDVPVVWGGTHPTIDPGNCIPHTDMICVGEGFDALLELSQRIAQGQPYDGIQNIWVNQNGRIVRNPARPLLSNLDILPPASFDSEDKIYIDDGRLQPQKNIDFFGYGFTDDPLRTVHQTMSSFGCPMGCSFCMNALVDGRFRRRSVSHVISELVEAKQRNSRLCMVFFWDNIFQVNKKWCLEFAEAYREKIHLPFFAYSHPLFVDEEILTALRKAGWAVTVMGIQSGSYHIRREVYGRNETNEQILKAACRLDKLKKIKHPWSIFKVYYDYVKDNPLEKEEELKESLDLILKMPKDFVFQAFNLSFFPNYILTKTYLEKGLISEADIEGNVATSGNNWISNFDSNKEYKGFLRMHEYYYLLFSLAQFKIFPNFLIRKIAERKLFFRHLRVLYWICRIVRFFDLFFSPANYVLLFGLMRIFSSRAKLTLRTLSRRH